MATPPYPNYGKAGEPSAPPPSGMPGAAYGPPPPAYPGNQQPHYGPPPQQANYQQKPQPTVRTSHGILGSLGSIGRDVAKGLNSIATEANSAYSRSVHGDIVAQLVTGTTIILISRVSGRSLQIVQSYDGRLIVDAACNDSPQIFNNKWRVTRYPTYCLLSNYNNYLAIEGGNLVLVTGIPDPSQAPPSARFKLHQSEHFLLLESAIAPHQYVAALESGQIKPPAATANDKYSQFGVQFCNFR